MDSFFFVPGNKLNKFERIAALDVDHIIIDLEDAIKQSEIEKITKVLKNSFEKFKRCYIRISLNNFDEVIDIRLLKHLVSLGYRKFVFPKLNNAKEFEAIIDQVNQKDIRVILLIESPSLLAECDTILSKHVDKMDGLGLGSHDFMSVIGGEHSLKNLEYVRQQVLYSARRFDLLAIDIASMELENSKDFLKEVQDGFDKGYDAKFIIHPWQLELLQNKQFYNLDNYNWALKIEKLVKEAGILGEFNAVRVDGQVIEKPHWNRVQKILKFYKRNDTK